VAERRTGLRLSIGFLAALVLVLEVQALVHSLRYQTSVQERALAQARWGFMAVRPQIEAALRDGSPAAAARVALGVGLASEVDFFDEGGRPILSMPAPSPARHWPEAGVVAALRPHGPILVMGPFVKPQPRILIYARIVSQGTPLFMRVSANARELVEDLRDRRPLLVGHGLAIGLLAILGGLALLPSRDTASASSAPAFGAYEEAMGRLRDQGEARTREHEAEKRRMEDQVKDSEAMARAGELTSGIVHEVRNGLGTIVGYARLLEKSAASLEAKQAAKGILDECQTLETVARRFIDFVRDETLNLAPVDCARLLSRVVARESRSLSGGKVRLGDLSGLPPVVGDEEMLERAFENVIRNAREAAGPAGHVEVRASVGPGDILKVSIADDGPGLPPDLPSSPRPFFTTKPGGLGLGLPMAFKIVRLHQGELILKNAAPRGLEVDMVLPLQGPA
jgi:signal transduction histidine kinase